MFNSLRLRILAAICVFPIVSFLLQIVLIEIFISKYLPGDSEKFKNLVVFHMFDNYVPQLKIEQLKKGFDVIINNKPHNILFFVVFDNEKNVVNGRNFEIFCEEKENISCLDLYIKSHTEATKNGQEYGIREIGD